MCEFFPQSLSASKTHASCCHLWPVSLHNMFSQTARFLEGKKFVENKTGFWFSVRICMKLFSFCEALSKILSKLYTWLHVKCPLLSSDFNYSPCVLPSRTLTYKRCILYIYSTNIGTEYFKHGIYCPFFFSSKCSLFHNSNAFGSCFIRILYTGCAKIKKK